MKEKRLLSKKDEYEVMGKFVCVFAGRLNFSSEPEDVLRERLKNLVNKHGHVFKEDEFAWRFGGIYHTENAIIGRFGKEKLIKNITQFDEEKNDFIEMPIKRREAFYSNFCIFPDDNIILFERRFGIGHIKFIKVFSDIYNKEYGLSLEIELLKDEKEITAIMEKSDMVTSINFTLRPTNPDAGDESKVVDNMIKEIRARKAGMNFLNKEEGLDYKKKGSIASSAIALCNRGYGKYTVGIKKGNEETKIDSIKKVAKEYMKPPERGKELNFFIKVWKKIKLRLD